MISRAAKENDRANWDATWKSTVGKELYTLNGNCKFTSDDGTSSAASTGCGYFSNSDASCDQECNVHKGFYYMVTSYIGA